MRNLILLVSVFLLFPGCGPSGIAIKDTNTFTPTTGLVLDRSKEPTLIYRRPGGPTLAEYNKFIIDPIIINYKDPDIQEIDKEKLNRLSKSFEELLKNELEAGGYRVTTKSGPNTMRMTFIIKSIKADQYGGGANVGVMAAGALAGLPGIVAISRGEVSVEAIFRDSMTNRINTIVITRSVGSRYLKNKPWSTWADVEGALDMWAEGLRNAIQEAHEKY